MIKLKLEQEEKDNTNQFSTLIFKVRTAKGGSLRNRFFWEGDRLLEVERAIVILGMKE